MTKKQSKNLLGAKKMSTSQIMLNLVFVLICLCYIVPFVMIISISISSNDAIIFNGFTIFPKEIDFTAYKIVFDNPAKILQAYKVTIEFTVAHVILSLVIQALSAYPISRSYFIGKKTVTWIIFLTMLFSAGMVPQYLIYTRYYGLGDSIMSYIMIGLMNAWNVMIIRTAYLSVPQEMLESARIDGCGEFRSFLTMVVPMTKPTYATLGFLTLVGKWNDWNTTLIYIRDTKLYSLQYLLQAMLNEVEMLKELANSGSFADMAGSIPTHQMQFALALVAAGPVLIIFPFFQRYFSKGMMVGSVKG